VPPSPLRIVLGTPFSILLRLSAPFNRAWLRFVVRKARLTNLRGFQVLVYESHTPDQANRQLLESRLKAALDVLATHAPRHFSWLLAGFPQIFVARVRGGFPIQPIAEFRLLRLSPKLVWHSNTEELSARLSVIAAFSRLRRAYKGHRKETTLRMTRRSFQESLWLSKRLGLDRDFQRKLEKRIQELAPLADA